MAMKTFGSISPTCLHAAFLRKDRSQRHSSHQCLFSILGTVCEKAGLKMLVKLIPRRYRCRGVQDEKKRAGRKSGKKID